MFPCPRCHQQGAMCVKAQGSPWWRRLPANSRMQPHKGRQICHTTTGILLGCTLHPRVQGELSDGGPSLSLLHPQSSHYLLLSVQSPHYLLCVPKGRPGSTGSLAHAHSSPAGPVNLGHSPQYLSRPSLAPSVTSLLLLSPFLSERQATCLQARMVGPF